MNLAGFNSNQIRAVKFKDGACCVLAGAGSGKTRVLTYRIANLIEEGVPANTILAVTFTKKASEEMKERLYNLIGIDAEQVNMGTFHSICYQILRTELNDSLELAQDWWQRKTVQEIMLPPSRKFPKGLNLNWSPRQALSFISYQKNNLIRENDTFILTENQKYIEDKLRQLYIQYEEQKKINGYIDFDDMLLMCHDLLRNDKRVLDKYRNKFRYILIDEFQDTNIVQSEIVKLLGKEHKNVFVVGDDFQSVYSFRAGNIDIILNFEKDWEDAKIIPLEINYRSTKNIVEWANKLIDKNKKQHKKNIRANRGEGKDPILFYGLDEDDEAEKIAKEIEQLLKNGYNPEDFAVIYRTNAQSRALEEAMIKAQIPYVVIGSASFYKRKEIKDMIAYLKLASNPTNDIELERIINRPNRYLGRAYLNSITEYAHSNNLSLYEALLECPESRSWRYKKGTMVIYRIIQQINEMSQQDCSPADVIEFIRKETDYDSWINEQEGEDGVDNDRIDNLNSLQTTARKFNSIDSFLNYIDMISQNQSNKKESNKVKLMTIHRSKGLEFPIVFLAGVTKGLLPHSNSYNIEEERRLCYVGMTRAEDILYISWTKYYQDIKAGESEFIKDMGVKVKEEQYYGYIENAS